MSHSNSSPNRLVTSLSALAAAGLIALGGTAIANAATSPTPTTSSSTSSGGASSSGSSGTSGTATDQGCGGPGGPGATADTAVTGTEASKVSAAVTAKDSTITVDSVRKDPDGSYDVLGTRAGEPVFVEVSKDLSTVTERTRGSSGRSALPGTNGSGSGQDDSAQSSSYTL